MGAMELALSMKVYLILANNSGGLYRFRKDLMEKMIQDGHCIYAVTPFDESINELRQIGVHLIEQQMNRRGTNPIQELKLLLAYMRVVRKICPDMIITYTIKPGIYGGLIARCVKIPYAVNITGLGTAFQRKRLFQKMIVRLWKTALKSAKCVFFENEENAQYFQRLSIVDGKRICVLHGAGVNLNEFPLTEYPMVQQEIRFLFIGRVMREKGIDELLDAMERLQRRYQDIMLDVIGWCEEDYERRLGELQQRGFVRFHGFQSDVKPFIANAHAFVLPSYHEGMANTLLEAAAMGRPLITSNIHGCMEAVVHGETGLLCEVQNVQSLEEQMERFINLPYEEKCVMGRLSHEHVARYFDKRKVVQETVDKLYSI